MVESPAESPARFAPPVWDEVVDLDDMESTDISVDVSVDGEDTEDDERTVGIGGRSGKESERPIPTPNSSVLAMTTPSGANGEGGGEGWGRGRGRGRGGDRSGDGGGDDGGSGEDDDDAFDADTGVATRWATPSSRTAAAAGAAVAVTAAAPLVLKVWIGDMRFSPSAVVIPAGSYVQFEQMKGCSVRQCLEVVDAERCTQAASPALLPGQPWRHRFEQTGEFEFKSLIYVFMKGTVTVVPVGATPSAPQPPLLPRSSSASTAAAALEAGSQC
mmetsp:Transcript_21493/g.53165  ORF Transcript_21493/g.53165 Transcript_21493/m.53165 type:complete len:273 (-) Transcript_21493:58-876(-)